MAENKDAKKRRCGYGGYAVWVLVALPMLLCATLALVCALPVWIFGRAVNCTGSRRERYGLLPPPEAPPTAKKAEPWDPFNKVKKPDAR